jgi:hypothetical protein
MPDSATSTVSDQVDVSGGDSQDIHFRPGQLGLINVHSVPSPHTAHSETGLLAEVFLRRPGTTTPLATAKFKVPSSSIGLTYNATAADLAIPGDWTCEISNASNDRINFATVVTFPIANPLVTVSIDTEFLNIVLAKLVDNAAIQIHLESTGDGSAASRLSLSPDMAALLNLPTVYAFNIADQTKTISLGIDIDIVFRITNLDSDPEYPVVVLWTDPPPSLKVVVRFDTASAKMIAQNLPAELLVPDIDVELFNIEINVGFSGSFQAVCTASATAHARVADVDVGSDVVSGVQDGINEQVRKNSALAALADPKQVKARIDNLFIQMMRLGPQAQIHNYRIDGQTLFVTYFQRTP